MRRGDMGRGERLILLAGGYMFALIGLAYLYLTRSPVLTFFETTLPAILFIMLGLVMIVRFAPWTPRLLAALRRRFPSAAAGLAAASARAKDGIARLFRRH